MKILKCNLTHLYSIYDIETENFPKHIQETKQDIISDLCRGYYYGLFDADLKMMGYFCFYINKGLYLNNLVICPEFQGKGYSKIIIQYLKQHIILYSIDRIWLHVSCWNDIALGLYNKCGFKIKDLADDFYAKGENAIIMEFS